METCVGENDVGMGVYDGLMLLIFFGGEFLATDPGMLMCCERISLV